MPGPNFVLDKGFYLDAAANKFEVVILTTTLEHVDDAASANELAIGILQETVTADDVTSGRVVDVRIMGISRAIANGAIAIGSRVRSAGDGKVAPLAAAAKQNVIGIAMTQATADGDHIDILLTPGLQVDNS
jgi:hypothetical protein